MDRFPCPDKRILTAQLATVETAEMAKRHVSEWVDAKTSALGAVEARPPVRLQDCDEPPRMTAAGSALLKNPALRSGLSPA